MAQNQDIRQLGFHLNHAFTALVSTLNHELKASGIPLNHSQFEIIQALWRSESTVMSQHDIAMTLGRDRAAISRTLAYLETHGFVSRYALSGSKNGVTLTPKTLSLKPLINHAVERAVAKACGNMLPGQYDAGIAFLIRVYDNLRSR